MKTTRDIHELPELYRRQGERVDAATRFELRRIRQAALHGGERRGQRWQWPLAGAALASALLAAVLVWPTGSGDPAAPTAPPVLALGAGIETELDQDAEFYAWLASAPIAVDEGERAQLQ